MPFLRKRGERKSLGSFAFDSNENFRESDEISERREAKRVKETFFADRYFSRSFLFSHPIISARRKVDGGKKERKRKETGRATVHGSITTAPTPPLAIAFHPPCFHLRVHR